MSEAVSEQAVLRQAPVLDVDPYDDAVLNEPFAMHETVRRAGPVAFLSRYGVYVMGRHKTVQATLKDWQTFSSAAGIGFTDIRKPGAWRPPSIIVEADPPNHTRVRSVLQKVLSPIVIRKWREEFEREAEKRVAELVARGTFDGVRDLSEPYVAKTFPDALGLRWSPERTENLYLIGNLNFDGQGPRNARFEATQKRAEPIMGWYQDHLKREAMEPGGFGDNVYKAADAGEIEHETAAHLMRSFLRGGLDTTASTISAALHYLARDPAQFALLRSAPDKARVAFEEAMRLETPIQGACRVTTRDVVVEDTLIPEESRVLLLFASANRDPAFWDRPDDFDMQRSTLGHVALGAGIHMCVGQMIARVEGEAVLKALAAHARELELVGPPVRRLNNNLRSLESLPLRATPA